MPMFEYRCAGCGSVNEFLVGVTSDDPEIVCASCGGTNLTKMISPVSFSVKESASRFKIASDCACGRELGAGGGCGGEGCSCSA